MDNWVYCFDPCPKQNSSKDRDVVEWQLPCFDLGQLPGQQPNLRIHQDRLAAKTGRYSMGKTKYRKYVLMTRFSE